MNTRKILVFICSIIFFPVSIALFIAWAGNNDSKKQKLGKQCVFISIVLSPLILFFFIRKLSNHFLDPIGIYFVKD